MDSSLLRNISEFINKPAKSTDSNLERNLDSELFKTASCLKRKTIQLDNATDSAALIDLDLKTKSEKIAKLQQDKHFLYEKTVSINDDYTRLKQELNDLKQSSCFQINQLESRINSLNDQVDEKSIELSNVVGKSSQDFIILNSKLSNLESRNKELTLKLSQQGDLFREKQSQVDILDGKLDQANQEILLLKSSPSISSSTESVDILTRQLSSKSQQVTTLSQKNLKLQQDLVYHQKMLENQEILKEEINKLNQQISLLGQLRPKLTSLEIENARLVAERKQWTGFLDGDQDPYTITKSLAKLKIENKSLLESIQQLQDKCRELTVNSKSYSSTIDDLNKKINNQILEIEQSNHEKNRISKSRALSIREIELLKNQLSLYNLEDSMSDVKLDEIKSVYISELQNLLQEYKSTVLNLEDEIKNKVVESIVIEKQIVDHGKEDTETTQLKQDLELSLIENKSLKSQLDDLMSTISNEGFDNEKYRILELVDNPESIKTASRQEQINHLEAENLKLREVINGTCSIMYPIESFNNLEYKIKKLESTISEKDKRLTRLKEVYSQKVSEFRDAVYSLLGYKIQVELDGRVILKSMYARSDFDACFVFNPDDGGSIQMINQTSEELEQQLKYFVCEVKSIPCLMAWCTMKGFEGS